jgi:hypothetical protein
VCVNKRCERPSARVHMRINCNSIYKFICDNIHKYIYIQIYSMQFRHARSSLSCTFSVVIKLAILYIKIEHIFAGSVSAPGTVQSQVDFLLLKVYSPIRSGTEIFIAEWDAIDDIGSMVQGWASWARPVVSTKTEEGKKNFGQQVGSFFKIIAKPIIAVGEAIADLVKKKEAAEVARKETLEADVRHASVPLPYALRKKTGTIPSHGFDTIIVATSEYTMDCADIKCNFNELFICPNIGMWHSFKNIEVSDRWYRNLQDPAWSVKQWRYIKSYNHNIEVYVKVGDWRHNCIEPVIPGHTETLITPSQVAQTGTRESYWEYFHHTDITCMRVAVKPARLVGSISHSYSCDVSKNTNGDHKFTQNRHRTQSINVALPAEISQHVYTANSNVEEQTRSLTERRNIESCAPGYISMWEEADDDDDGDDDKWIYKCIVDDFCGQGNAVGCKNEDIAIRCEFELSTSNTAFETCFDKNVERCQNMRVLKREPRYGTEPCIYAHALCSGLKFYDLDEDECRDCIAPGADLIEEVGYECRGAYAGRHTCRDDGDYMAMISTDGRETVSMVGTSLQYDVRCLSCRTVSAYNMREVPDSCLTEWEVIIIGATPGYQLVSQGYQYTLCTLPNSECTVGQYTNCQTYNCIPCSCDPQCVANTDYCLVDADVCSGFTFNNSGSKCMALNTVSCDIGYVLDLSGYDASHGNNIQTYTTDDDVKLKGDLCQLCEHPRTTRYCEDGWFWPGCTSSGMNSTPPCELCPADQKPDNSVWSERINPYGSPAEFDECTWECEIDFYKNATSCVSCKSFPCTYGTFRPGCNQGTETLPVCVGCNELLGPGCEAGNYPRKCDGSGYRSMNNTATECTQCSTAESLNCPDSAPFDECDTRDQYDTSACVACETVDGLSPEGIYDYTGTCVFDCDVSYYRQRSPSTNSVDENAHVYSCIPCETKAKDVCSCDVLNEDDCNKRYELSKCDKVALTQPPTCSCQPGHGSSVVNGADICTECVQFTAPDSYQKCNLCNGGYSGSTEKGSATCEPCPVNTYRPALINGERNFKGCETCAAGTDNLVASKTCEPCENGKVARFVEWSGYLFNYNNDSWVHHKGFPPNQCVVRGMSTDLMICDTADVDDIKWRHDLEDTTSYKHDQIEVQYDCGECAGGLAYLPNFDTSIAPRDEL